MQQRLDRLSEKDKNGAGGFAHGSRGAEVLPER
jgi:hypothetical protein